MTHPKVRGAGLTTRLSTALHCLTQFSGQKGQMLSVTEREGSNQKNERITTPGLLLLHASLPSFPQVSTFSSMNSSPIRATHRSLLQHFQSTLTSLLSDSFFLLMQPRLYNLALHPTLFCIVCRNMQEEYDGEESIFDTDSSSQNIFRKAQLSSSITPKHLIWTEQRHAKALLRQGWTVRAECINT